MAAMVMMLMIVDMDNDSNLLKCGTMKYMYSGRTKKKCIFKIQAAQV
jgi:hypothetical protein